MSDTHRRDFVRSLALGASAGLLVPPALSADDEPKKDDAKKDEPKPKDEPRSELDARMDVVIARYGKHLDESARKAVRAELQGLIRRAEALKKFPLTNGDEPLPTFHPYRAPLA